ncbi:MAG: purine-nucleoside phosphorylase [Verrucomicrobiota bacterium JB023]|nr:purine-nucleoside phosphorylase [Verrucomicrobiota bacterium JB023]
MPTPHIEASAGEFAETVLLPGDPLRAKYIADTFLTDVSQVNGVRNMLGFTGTYEGRRISVMGSGMGIPSLSIYCKELITEYGVKNIIRVGSCGAVSKEVGVRDIIIGHGAGTDSGVNRARFGGYDFAAVADFALTRAAVESAERQGIEVKIGSLFSADLFYTPVPEMFDRMEAMGILAVEMEAAGLFGVCAEFGAKGLAVCTVSDHIRTGESLSSEEREKGFSDMMKIVLEMNC